MRKQVVVLGVALALATTGAVAKSAATINDIVITVEEAQIALDLLTKGEKKWADLPEDAKKQLIQMMAPSKLVAQAAQKTLSKKEVEAALSGFWMQKKMATVKVSDEDAKKLYDKMVKMSKESKSKEKIPEFEKVKNNLKVRFAQEQVVAELMKSAKIEVK
jgi:hypothetical protein